MARTGYIEYNSGFSVPVWQLENPVEASPASLVTLSPTGQNPRVERKTLQFDSRWKLFLWLSSSGRPE